MFNEVAYLITDVITYDDTGNTVKTRTEKQVFVAPRSIGMKEFYQAQVVGLKPDLTLVLADYWDYSNEKALKYHDEVYDITRVYIRENRIELICTHRINEN